MNTAKRTKNKATLITALAIAGLLWPALQLHAASANGSNTGNVTIPDAGGYVSSTITISSAPAGAVVTGIDVYFRCMHTYSGDLTVDLNADSTGSLGNYRLWNREGGSADNPTRTTTGISTFNGLSVNRTWYLYAKDWSSGDTGYIDEWTITVYYADPTTYSITPNPASVSESAGSLTFTITRSGGTPAETIYASTTQTEGYVNNSDYTGISSQAVSFTSGQTTRTVTVTILNDSTYESSETFGFIVQRNASDPVTTYLAKSTFTITDDDSQPTTYSITANPATVSESAGSLTFTITRSGGTPAETIYASTTQTEGYVNNSDYTGISSQAVSFTSGQTTRTVTVTILNDSTYETSETFGFIVQRNASDPVTTYLAKSTFTITDDDLQPTTYSITPNPATVSESAGTLTFTITRSGGTPAETIYASTTQTEGYSNSGDYAGINSQALNFTSGQTTTTVTVTILNDSTYETSETFGFIVQRNATDPLTTYLAKSTFTITDDDLQPTTYSITPNPATVSESAGTLTFTITRSGGTPSETIYASTTQTEGYVNNNDYTGVNSQTVSFTSGQTIHTVTVTILNDSTYETSETFGFIVQRNASDPVTTYLAKSTFTITDDDSQIDPPVSDGFDYPIGARVRYTEANDGDGWYVAQEFNEFNSSNAKYHLGEDWNAETGGNTDYGSPVYSVANGTIVFAGPATISGWGNVLIIRHKLPDLTLVESLYGHVSSFSRTSGNVTRGEQVAAIGDGGGLYAAHLHLELRYSNCPYWGSEGYGYSAAPSPAGWTDASAFIDAHRPSLSTTYAITPSQPTVNENAGSITFTISRSGALPAETVYASTTQTEGYSNSSDYTGILNQSVAFTSGQTTRTVAVTINDDAIAESSETFGLIIQRFTSDPVTTYLAKTTFTIADNDGGGTLKPLGVDVSKYNGTVDWNLVRNAGGKTFAFIRATAGKNTTDEFFAQNIVNSRNAGLLVGAYHFAYPEYFTAHEEAQKFLSVAAPYIGAGYLPPVLDIEDSASENSFPYRMGASALSQWIRDWCSEVEAATGVTGRKAILYTFRWYPRNGYFQTDLNQHPFWVATYPTDPDTDPGDITPWSTWTFQQYRTDPTTQQTPPEQGGTCPGIRGGSGYADLDSFNGTTAALNALAGTTGGGASSPTINSAKLSGTTFTLATTTETGYSYILEYKNSLADANWIPVQTNSGTGGQISLTNTAATGPARLYHIRVR